MHIHLIRLMVRAIKKPILISLVGLYSLLITTHAHSIDVGKIAPSFELSGNVSGNGNGSKNAATVSLQQFQGKVIYLDFWASWCGPCKQSFPWLNEMQSKYGSQGFQVVAINLDVKLTDVQDFLKSQTAKFVIAFDSQSVTPKAYGIKGMPSSFLIGKDGRILSQHTGFRESDKSTLETHIQMALGIKKNELEKYAAQ
jgi:cytochrome c biogenesis protein CcmG/thiol:disulfide interchange protein DsbE